MGFATTRWPCGGCWSIARDTVICPSPRVHRRVVETSLRDVALFLPFWCNKGEQTGAKCDIKRRTEIARSYRGRRTKRQPPAQRGKRRLTLLFPATNQEVASSSLAGRATHLIVSSDTKPSAKVVAPRHVARRRTSHRPRSHFTRRSCGWRPRFAVDLIHGGPQCSVEQSLRESPSARIARPRAGISGAKTTPRVLTAMCPSMLRATRGGCGADRKPANRATSTTVIAPDPQRQQQALAFR